MSGYTIEDDENYVLVNGKLKEDGEVKVKYNDKNYVFRPEDGDYSEGVCTAELYCSDGSYVDEGAVKQEIRLPDGSKIRKGAVERSLELPNGKKINNNSTQSNSESNVVVKDSSGSVSISISTSSTVSVCSRTNTSKDEKDMNDTNTDTESKSEDIVTKKELIDSAIPGFFTIVLIGVGLMNGSPIALLTGVGLYCAYFVPVLLGYVAQYLFLDNNEPEEDSMSEVEKLKEKYKNGEVTDVEFENELEDILDQNQELEIENSYN